MTEAAITGSFVAIATPMNADSSIDFGGFEALLDWHRSHGTSAVLIMGSTGEVSMLTAEEKREVISRTSRMKSGAMLHFYGCTGPSTAATVEMTRYAAAEGADGAILAAPSYICGSEDDIEAYFLEVADSVELDLGIYNNPPRVKTDLGHEALLRLFTHPNYAIHKESTARVGQVARILEARPCVSVMCCDSPNLGLVVPTMTLGGHGTANMTGNLAPQEMAMLSEPLDTAEKALAWREHYLRLLPLLHFTYSAINPVPVKSLMQALGLPSGPMRRPLRALSPEKLADGLRIVRELGLDQKYGWTLGARASAA